MRRKPGGAHPHSLRTHCQRGVDVAAGRDAAGSKHWQFAGHVNDLRDESKCSDLSRVRASIVALRDQNIDRLCECALRVTGRTNQRNDFLPTRLDRKEAQAFVQLVPNSIHITDGQ